MTTRARNLSHFPPAGAVFATLTLTSALFIEFLENESGTTGSSLVTTSFFYALFGTAAVAIPLIMADKMSRPLPFNIQILALIPVVLLTATIWALVAGQSPGLLIFFYFLYWGVLWAGRLIPKEKRGLYMQDLAPKTTDDID